MQTWGIAMIVFVGLSIIPVFAQTPDSPLPSGIGTWFNSFWDKLGQELSNLSGSAQIPPNPINLTSDKLQTITNSGFDVATKVKDLSFSANKFTVNVINSLSPVKISAIILFLIGAGVTLFFLRNQVRVLIRHLYAVVGIVLVLLFILFYLGVRSSIGV